MKAPPLKPLADQVLPAEPENTVNPFLDFRDSKATGCEGGGSLCGRSSFCKRIKTCC